MVCGVCVRVCVCVSIDVSLFVYMCLIDLLSACI